MNSYLFDINFDSNINNIRRAGHSHKPMQIHCKRERHAHSPRREFSRAFAPHTERVVYAWSASATHLQEDHEKSGLQLVRQSIRGASQRNQGLLRAWHGGHHRQAARWHRKRHKDVS